MNLIKKELYQKQLKPKCEYLICFLKTVNRCAEWMYIDIFLFYDVLYIVRELITAALDPTI